MHGIQCHRHGQQVETPKCYLRRKMWHVSLAVSLNRIWKIKALISSWICVQLAIVFIFGTTPSWSDDEESTVIGDSAFTYTHKPAVSLCLTLVNLAVASGDLHGGGIDGSTADSAVYPRYSGLNENKYCSSHGDRVNTGDNTAVIGLTLVTTPRWWG